MATAKQGSVRITSSEEKPADPDNLKEQIVGNPSVTIGHLNDATYQSGSLRSGGDFNTAFSPNAHAFQPVYNGGNENSTSKWDKYPSYFNSGGFEIGYPDIHSENPSLMFHGYGYSPQMTYGTYYPVSTKLPSVRGDGLYPAQHFPISDQPYYQQPVSPHISYIASPTPVSQAKFPVNTDQRGDSKLFGPRPGFSPPLGSFGGAYNFSGNSGDLGFLQQGFGYGEPWSDRSNLSNGQSSLAQLPSPASPLQPVGSLGLSGNRDRKASQQGRPLYGFECCSNSYYRGYPHSGNSRGSGFRSVSSSNLGMNGQSWLTLNKARHGVINDSLCSCSGTLDTLCELNRGPRASKPKSQTISNGFSVSNSKNIIANKVHGGSYNQLDFVTEYEDAKFFIVKSYSEDNVHKSIKYSVWTSTPNGNKKLDAAYHEAREKQGTCPIFLLFSANASAQFCGVAEMVGPVDFGKTVDYWQQDKWTGHFPVKWDIVKDVPNSQFRHIILENNDNKPVTNSRDTQEVELEQGIEMLNIFKNYESYSSILDDFEYYENRQKAMQERKAKEKASAVAAPVVEGHEHRNPVPVPIPLPSDFIKQMSKSFAQVVLMNENEEEHSAAGQKGDTVKATFVGGGVKPEEIKTTVASNQSQ